MKILCGDISHGKTQLALLDYRHGKFSFVHKAHYRTKGGETFGAVLTSFLDYTGHKPDQACLAIGAPVEERGDGQVSEIGQENWSLDSGVLARGFNIPVFRLVNECQAVAFGLEFLKASEQSVIQGRDIDDRQRRLVVSVAHTLSVCVRPDKQKKLSLLPIQVGLAEFAPSNDEQLQLLSDMMATLGRVTWADVLSNSGLLRIFKILQGRGLIVSADLRAALAESRDQTQEIITFALAGRDPVAINAVDLFSDILAGFCANQAAMHNARGGIFLTGSMPRHLAAIFKKPGFLEQFNKNHNNNDIRLSIILSQDTALRGSAVIASIL